MHKKSIIITLLAIVAGGILAGGCKSFEKVPENAAFAFEAVAEEGTAEDGVTLLLALTEGSAEGKCTLSLSVTDAASGKTVGAWRLLANGRTIISEGDEWSFDKKGTASFLIDGLPEGKYNANIKVRRWYHTASAKTAIIVSQ